MTIDEREKALLERAMTLALQAEDLEKQKAAAARAQYTQADLFVAWLVGVAAGAALAALVL